MRRSFIWLVLALGAGIGSVALTHTVMMSPPSAATDFCANSDCLTSGKKGDFACDNPACARDKVVRQVLRCENSACEHKDQSQLETAGNLPPIEVPSAADPGNSLKPEVKVEE
jgi:hypothetical protein